MTTPNGRGRRADIVILTGLSGAGKSTAAKAFEDLGYYCVDNLPPILIPKIVEVVSEARGEDARVALGVDVRGKEFLPDMEKVLEELRGGRNAVHVLFLDAADDVLMRRFSETRRVHPVAARGAKEAIRKEREILSALRRMADEAIDTSNLTVHQLRDTLVRRFHREGSRGLQVSVISFGYRYGIPADADMVVDVRFLPNPNFVASLKRYTGLHRKVRDYVLRASTARSFLRRLMAMLHFLLPLYRKEGKAYFTLGVGCTGGRHRSVAVAAALGNILGKEDEAVVVVHRDLARSSLTPKGAR
ncbi:MAG: glmZ(sRNA)-inactivating NTPase [Deltaproteobacteria bacterium]|nr:glmZ(sRNA)-inactivating NTPase [Deltaproteobacteria bacterium]